MKKKIIKSVTASIENPNRTTLELEKNFGISKSSIQRYLNNES